MHQPTMNIPPSVLGSIFFYLLVFAIGVAAWIGWLIWRGKRRSRAVGLSAGRRAKPMHSRHAHRVKR